jgi:hypothetical protein
MEKMQNNRKWSLIKKNSGKNGGKVTEETEA